VVELIVPVLSPPEREKATVAPPVVRRFPFSSLAVKVRIVLEPETTELAAAETSEVEAEIGPAVTVIVGAVVVTGLSPMVALIVVAVPATIAAKGAL
jgi:hypothetical protein